ncbi:MAG: hypothetical protein EOP26_03430 [Rhodococcus sp. (in: high G+C Gram-positive bacteria)]|nr:MAG: hypothetical protein EOP26_03430 [Rhodococcus sp. (in: high G+C Gram-positive bacteria)]
MPANVCGFASAGVLAVVVVVVVVVGLVDVVVLVVAVVVVFGAVVTVGVVAGPATTPVSGDPSTERPQPATTNAVANRITARTV